MELEFQTVDGQIGMRTLWSRIRGMNEWNKTEKKCE